jgi:hypothetical protein
MKNPSKSDRQPVRKDFTDTDGVPRRVLLPHGETDTSMGIPVSLDLSEVYGHMPDDFQTRLYTALHAQGLVEAGDYLKAGADQRFKAAMLSVIRNDFLSVQTIAKQELDHARRT